ncbi:hypothetical protein [Phenylobacterium koreense]|uniref:17 kDa surface antigen n=1 Tax=Phenylobacterium koreense TaxID=266125 RepID=A0ABV2EN31_9CAUL
MRAAKIALAGTAALSLAAPAAFAQYPTPYQPTEQYRQDLQQYQGDRADYDAARQDYEVRRAQWERAREQYDRQYGYGAYARAYGPAPVWTDPYLPAAGAPYDPARADYERRLADYDRARADYDRRWGPGAYARAYGPPPAWSAGDYATDTSAFVSNDPSCTNSKTNRSIAGSVIGALIGSALGSNIAARGVRTEGAVLGALVGGGVGLGVGRASARCDEHGYYFSYDQTVPYRESDYDRARRSGQYDYSYYDAQRCRLAPAPAGDQYRYVRVCPDSQGRYRITS